MSIDFNNPVKTQNYDTGMLASIRAHQIALAQWLDPAVAGALSNVPTGAYQLDGGALKRYNGSSWAAQSINGINWDGTRATIGSATPLVFAGITPNLQVQASHSGASGGFARFSAGISGSTLYLGHSRGTAVGVHAALQANDELGVVTFVGSDGTDLLEGARIRGIVDGAVAAGDMPVRLDFYTRAAGGSASTLALSLKGDNTAQFSGAARLNGAIYGTLGVRQGGAYGGAGGANSNYDDIVVENSSNAGITILTPNTATAAFNFGDPESNVSGRVTYSHTSDTLSLYTAGVSRFGISATAATFANGVDVVADSFEGALTHASGYFNIKPYNGTYDDGSNARFYWDGNNGKLIFQRNGGTGTAGCSIDATSFIGEGVLDAGSTVGGLDIGFAGVPLLASAATASTSANGKGYNQSGNITVNSGWAAGSAFLVANNNAFSIQVIKGTIGTMKLANSTSTGSRTVPANSWAVVFFPTTTTCIVGGPGVS